MSNLMTVWLSDAPPVRFDSRGELQSWFPFEIMEVTCDLCGDRLVKINGLLQCPACPVINDFIVLSRIALERFKSTQAKIQLRVAA